jgi:two-component system OmpR family sensor kinase
MKHARSLRGRLVLMHLTVFGLIQVLVGITILALVAVSTRLEMDRYLYAVAEDLADEADDIAASQGSATEAAPRVRQRKPRVGHWEIHSRDGQVTQSSQTLGAVALPLPPTEPSGTRRAYFYTARTGDAASALGPLRIVRIYRDAPGVQPYYVQVAREITTLERNLHNLRLLILTVIPLGLVASAIGANVVARRSLTPLGQMLDEARSITAADLHRRLPQPTTRDEIGQLAEVLNGMLSRLENAFDSQERFTADVSHELKTPLIALAAEAADLARPESDERRRVEFLRDAAARCDRLARTVESFLMLARAEAGSPIARPEAVLLEEVATSAVSICTSEAQQRSIRIRATLPVPAEGEPDLIVSGDPDLLRSMIENLLRNAIRHGPGGSVVDLALARENESAVVRVIDQGPGIPADQLARMFTRFARLTTASRDGTGLGLAIARAIAQLHGGAIAGNHQPSGFEMRVMLPLAPEPEPAT